MIDLTIIIINWNTRDMLEACLRSVFRHLDGVHAELIVVDNDSRDGSADMVAAHFPQAKLVRNEANIGFARANNQALRMARGRYRLLLNPDTIITSDVFRASLDYMETHPAVGVLGCRVLNSDRSVQMTCFRFPDLRYLLLTAVGAHHLMKRLGQTGWHRMLDWQRDSARDVQVVTGCYFCVRQSAVEEVGLLDEQFFFYGEETDWCMRFQRAGWLVRFAPVGEIIHHGGASSMQLGEGRMLAMADALVRLHRKHRGRISAGIAWWLCLLFNLVRAIGFAGLALVKRDPLARTRRNEYFAAVRAFRSIGRGSDGADLPRAMGDRPASESSPSRQGLQWQCTAPDA